MSGFTSSKADEEDEIESLSAPGTGIYKSALWDEECLESWRDYIEMEDQSV